MTDDFFKNKHSAANGNFSVPTSRDKQLEITPCNTGVSFEYAHKYKKTADVVENETKLNFSYSNDKDKLSESILSGIIRFILFIVQLFKKKC